VHPSGNSLFGGVRLLLCVTAISTVNHRQFGADTSDLPNSPPGDKLLLLRPAVQRVECARMRCSGALRTVNLG
jgi:hypothetical protein